MRALRELANPPKLAGAVERRTDVQIGKNGNTDSTTGSRPSWKGDLVALVAKASGLDDKPPDGWREYSRAQEKDQKPAILQRTCDTYTMRLWS